MNPTMFTVLGAFSSGKSSLMNLLLHKQNDVSPNDATPQKWRTLQGIAEDTNLPIEDVQKLVAEHPSLFLRRVVGGIAVYKLADNWQYQLAEQEGTTEQKLAQEIAQMR